MKYIFNLNDSLFFSTNTSVSMIFFQAGLLRNCFRDNITDKYAQRGSREQDTFMPPA